MYIKNADWLKEIGEYWLSFTEPASDGGMERRVLFEDGADVDFVISDTESFRKGIENILINGIPDSVKYTLSKGIKVLVDKDGILDDIISLETFGYNASPPPEYEFQNLVNDFIYHYIWTLKKLKRGEIWTAKMCCDNYMKYKLLMMAECHAHAIHGWSYDTWHSGRYLENWADKRLIDRLKSSFAHYEYGEILNALKETYEIFRILAAETAEKLNYAYPSDIERKVLEWAENNLL